MPEYQNFMHRSLKKLDILIEWVLSILHFSEARHPLVSKRLFLVLAIKFLATQFYFVRSKLDYNDHWWLAHFTFVKLLSSCIANSAMWLIAVIFKKAQNLCRSCVSWTKGIICSIRKQMGYYSVIWSYAELMRKKPGNKGPYKTIGTKRDHMGPHRTKRDHTGP